MTLPKAKKIKLINKAKFAKLAKKVDKIMKEEAEYLHKKRVENEYYSNIGGPYIYN